jgi:3-methylcrotonyl-CoA carboxylase beta subunit
MGGEQAGTVLTRVRERGGASGPDDGSLRDEVKAQYERQSHPYYASARLWDDGVIDMVETRDVLGASLATALNAPLPAETPLGVLRM